MIDRYHLSREVCDTPNSRDFVAGRLKPLALIASEGKIFRGLPRYRFLRAKRYPAACGGEINLLICVNHVLFL